MDKQINLIDLLKMYLKRWWYFVIVMLVFGVISGIYTMTLVTPLYTSSGTLYTENAVSSAGQGVAEVDYYTVMARKELVGTYSEILSSDSFVEEVAEKTALGYTGKEISRMTSYGSKNGTEILVVSVTTANPEHSYIIAQKVVDLAPAFVAKIVEGGSLKLLDQPSYSENPTSPSLVRNVEIGMILGFLLCAVAIFLLEILDNKIKNVKTISDTFKYPILGEIPYFISNKKETMSKKNVKENKR